MIARRETAHKCRHTPPGVDSLPPGKSILAQGEPAHKCRPQPPLVAASVAGEAAIDTGHEDDAVDGGRGKKQPVAWD